MSYSIEKVKKIRVAVLSLGVAGGRREKSESWACDRDVLVRYVLGVPIHKKRSDQRPTTAPRPVAVLSLGVAGGRRDQNAEVEHGSTSATGDSVAGPVSIEM